MQTALFPCPRASRLAPALLSLLVGLATTTEAQVSAPVAGESAPRKLAFLIPGLLEQHLRSVDPAVRPLLQEVLGPGVAPTIVSLNGSIVTHLSNLPLSSPAAAPAVSANPRTGAVANDSLGPILTERAETLGTNRFVVALTHQRFQFDRSDGLNLRDFGVTLPVQIPIGADLLATGIVETRTYVGIDIAQTTAYLVYGLTDRLDVTLATPVVTTSITLRSQASLDVPALGLSVNPPVQWIQASATGIGDQVVRVKQRLNDRGVLFAVATDVRMPTGDEYDFHGAGAWGLRGVGIASTTFSRISPHVNAGYEWNGASILASHSGFEAGQLPDRVFVNGGFDAVISNQFTVAVDLMAQILPKAVRTRVDDVSDASGQTLRTLTSADERQHQASLAAGFKARLSGRLNVTANALIRLNEAGLRARVVPTLSVSLSPRPPSGTTGAGQNASRSRQ